MKKVLVLTAGLAAGFGLAGCGYTPEQGAINGAALGGATGAIVGGAATGKAGGALAGGLLGAAAGGIIGANNVVPPPPPPPPPRRCAEFEVDAYGGRHCIAWYN
jgi:osmotically inducible lipoprotein OsmB